MHIQQRKMPLALFMPIPFHSHDGHQESHLQLSCILHNVKTTYHHFLIIFFMSKVNTHTALGKSPKNWQWNMSKTEFMTFIFIHVVWCTSKTFTHLSVCVNSDYVGVKLRRMRHLLVVQICKTTRENGLTVGRTQRVKCRNWWQLPQYWTVCHWWKECLASWQGINAGTCREADVYAHAYTVPACTHPHNQMCNLTIWLQWMCRVSASED